MSSPGLGINARVMNSLMFFHGLESLAVSMAVTRQKCSMSRLIEKVLNRCNFYSHHSMLNYSSWLFHRFHSYGFFLIVEDYMTA